MSVEDLKRVNWQDGMALNKEHFIQTEDYFIWQLCDYSQLLINKYNYGFLPKSCDDYKDGQIIELHERLDGKIRITLIACNIITLDGIKINISASEASKLNLCCSFDTNKMISNQNVLSVMLSVFPFQRMACGVIDSSEEPPRIPNVQTVLKLKLLDSLNTIDVDTSSIIIAKIRYSMGRWIIDNSYIPPSLSMISLNSLSELYINSKDLVIRLLNYCREIIDKINLYDNNINLTRNIKLLCLSIYSFLNTNLYYFNSYLKYQRPIDFINFFVKIAACVDNTFLRINKTHTIELLEYFNEWTSILPGDFKTIVSDLLSLEYESLDINHSMHTLVQFMKNLVFVMEKMCELDYIGRHRENLVISRT